MFLSDLMTLHFDLVSVASSVTNKLAMLPTTNRVALAYAMHMHMLVRKHQAIKAFIHLEHKAFIQLRDNADRVRGL